MKTKRVIFQILALSIICPSVKAMNLKHGNGKIVQYLDSIKKKTAHIVITEEAIARRYIKNMNASAVKELQKKFQNSKNLLEKLTLEEKKISPDIGSIGRMDIKTVKITLTTAQEKVMELMKILNILSSRITPNTIYKLQDKNMVEKLEQSLAETNAAIEQIYKGVQAERKKLSEMFKTKLFK